MNTQLLLQSDLPTPPGKYQIPHITADISYGIYRTAGNQSCILQMPSGPARTGEPGVPPGTVIEVCDLGANADQYPITLMAYDGDSLSGLSFAVISSARGTVRARYFASSMWHVEGTDFREQQSWGTLASTDPNNLVLNLPNWVEQLPNSQIGNIHVPIRFLANSRNTGDVKISVNGFPAMHIMKAVNPGQLAFLSGGEIDVNQVITIISDNPLGYYQLI